MKKVASSERYAVRSFPLREGLFLLRYAGARDTSRPPRVVVSKKPGSDDDVHFLSSPGTRDNTLTPGDAIAISAAAACEILIMTCSDALAVSDDVDIKLDVLGTHRAGSTRSGARELGFTGEGDVFDASLEEAVVAVSGHIQGVGDVTAGPSGWLGSLNGRKWIEGFSIGWERPIPGVKLSYAADILNRGRTKMCLAGQYAGTRRQSLPVVGLVLELSGAAASTHELTVSASFLESGLQVQSGRRVELAGPGGEDPLTGLMVLVRPAVPAATDAPAPRSRVKVFRAQGGRG